jgi:hypothetical protein
MFFKKFFRSLISTLISFLIVFSQFNLFNFSFVPKVFANENMSKRIKENVNERIKENMNKNMNERIKESMNKNTNERIKELKRNKLYASDLRSFNVSDNNPETGTGWNYSGNVYTITANGNYLITGVTDEEALNRITVNPNVKAEIILQDVCIDFSSSANDVSPFELQAGANVTLILSGKNSISAKLGFPNETSALRVPETAKIEIKAIKPNDDNSGLLEIKGSFGGAAIGGNGNSLGDGENAGEITISGGTINATGYSGAAIGGGEAGIDGSGSGGSGGRIKISGGMINAEGNAGAAIGGGHGQFGNGGDGGEITISGGTVNAAGDAGAAIGGGYGYSASYSASKKKMRVQLRFPEK